MEKIVSEARIDELLAIVTKLDDVSRAEVLQAISKKLDISAKNFHLNNIKRYVQASDQDIKDWLVTAVAESYSSGGNLMYSDLKKLKVSPANTTPIVALWTADKIRQLDLLSVQKDSVNALMSDAYLDFANGLNGIVKGVEHVLNETIKRQVRAQVVSGQITGSSIREITKEISELLSGQGFSILIDRGGRQWDIKKYSEMLARTHVIKSANEGVIARAVEFGVDTLMVSTHAGACKICQPYEGQLYSINRKGKYNNVGEFPNPIHPNCRHRLLPRPDLDEI